MFDDSCDLMNWASFKCFYTVVYKILSHPSLLDILLLKWMQRFIETCKHIWHKQTLYNSHKLDSQYLVWALLFKDIPKHFFVHSLLLFLFLTRWSNITSIILRSSQDLLHHWSNAVPNYGRASIVFYRWLWYTVLCL